MSKNNQKVIKILVGIAAGLLAATYGAVLNRVLRDEVFHDQRPPEEDSKEAGPVQGSRQP